MFASNEEYTRFRKEHEDLMRKNKSLEIEIDRLYKANLELETKVYLQSLHLKAYEDIVKAYGESQI